MEKHEPELTRAAAELTVVLGVALQRGFRRGRRAASVELLTELTALNRAMEEWLTADAEPGEAETLALIDRYRLVTSLVADSIVLAANDEKP